MDEKCVVWTDLSDCMSWTNLTFMTRNLTCMFFESNGFDILQNDLFGVFWLVRMIDCGLSKLYHVRSLVFRNLTWVVGQILEFDQSVVEPNLVFDRWGTCKFRLVGI